MARPPFYGLQDVPSSNSGTGNNRNSNTLQELDSVEPDPVEKNTCNLLRLDSIFHDKSIKLC